MSEWQPSLPCLAGGCPRSVAGFSSTVCIPSSTSTRRWTGARPSSTKWNRYHGRDIIPLWVADMDFRCAPAIVQALRARVDHGIFGYTEPPAELAATLAQALQRDHGWRIEADWIIWLPSLVVGLNVVSRAFAEEGDDILTCVPIYPPFLSAPQNGNRNAVRVPLALEPQPGICRSQAVALGVGHAGAGARRRRRARACCCCAVRTIRPAACGRGPSWNSSRSFALRHDLIVCSDEIHCGLVLDADKQHIPLASLSAGDRGAHRHADVGEQDLQPADAGLRVRDRIQPRAACARQARHGRHRAPRGRPGVHGDASRLCRAGATGSSPCSTTCAGTGIWWSSAIGSMPGLRTWHVEATYLAWIDARGLGVDNPLRFFEEAGVGLYDGALFGAPGFLRLNFACPRTALATALSRMSRAVQRT